jgi:hypothetical protein
MKYKLAIVLFLFSAVSAQNRLSLNLEKGAIYYQHSSANLTIDEEANGQKTTTRSVVSGVMRFKVMGKSGSQYEMEVAYTELNVTMNTPSGEVTFSTLKPNDDKDIFSKLLKHLINHAFYITMQSNGMIKQVRGVDSLWSGMTREFPDMGEAQKAQLIKQLKQSYGENSIKGNIEQLTAIFPNEKVKLNDEWQDSIHMKSTLSSVITNHFRLVSYNPQFAEIENHANTKTTDDLTEINGMPAKYHLSGPTESKIKIDSKTGWITEAEIDQHLKGTLEITDNPKIPGGVSVPMEFHIISKITDK